MAIITPNKRKAKRLTPRQKMERAGPPLSKLKQLAKTNAPPQRWYDERDNPLESSGKK